MGLETSMNFEPLSPCLDLILNTHKSSASAIPTLLEKLIDVAKKFFKMLFGSKRNLSSLQLRVELTNPSVKRNLTSLFEAAAKPLKE
jgi:hypothetical protein